MARVNLRRRAALAASLLLLGSVGCAFPHGSTAGDPILGSFHRPIVATPPPERGGLGLDSPAYDGGARIGMTSPDIPTPVENSSGFMSLPNLTSPNLFSGARTPFGSPDDSNYTRRHAGPSGARLPSMSGGSMRMPGLPAYARTAPDAAMPRFRDPVAALASNSSFTPVDPPSPIQQASYQPRPNRTKLATVEDAHAQLQDLGARGLRSEQMSNGEWLHTCTIGHKVLEGRGNDQFTAMCKVLEQAQNDR